MGTYNDGVLDANRDIELGWFSPVEYTDEQIRERIDVCLDETKEYMDGYIAETQRKREEIIFEMEMEWNAKQESGNR